MVVDSVSIFISYSHKDEDWREKLGAHLAGLRLDKLISEWHDRKIVPGSPYDDVIKQQLASADIILLLLSADFINSGYSNDVEIAEAMRRHEAGEAVVIPIVLRACEWAHRPYGGLQCFPRDGKPVTDWPTHDEAFKAAVIGIRDVARQIIERRKQKQQDLAEIRGNYRKKAEEVLNDGEISIGERDTLDELRDKLGLTKDDADRIEREAMEPVKRLNEAIEGYRKTLRKILALGWPISPQGRDDLDLRKRDLGLKDSEVERIEGPMLAHARALHDTRPAAKAPHAAPQAAPAPQAPVAPARAAPGGSLTADAAAAPPAPAAAPWAAASPAPAPKPGIPAWLKWAGAILLILIIWVFRHDMLAVFSGSDTGASSEDPGVTSTDAGVPSPGPGPKE